MLLSGLLAYLAKFVIDNKVKLLTIKPINKWMDSHKTQMSLPDRQSGMDNDQRSSLGLL